MESLVKEGKYIYCIINESNPKTFRALGIGDRGDDLYTVCSDGVAAVVSNSPVKKYAVSRDNTLAHEKAIETVMKEYAVLPVRFCTIAENEEMVKKILEKEQGRFKELFKSIAGKKELGLKVMFRQDAVYGEILQKYKKISSLKKEIEVLPPLKTHFQRMEIGRMVETALRSEKELYKEEILKALTPLAVDVKHNTTYGEIMVLNAAFLVEDEKEAEFDQKVDELDEKFGRLMSFKYTGNLPPFNFVNLVIDTSTYAECPTGRD